MKKIREALDNARLAMADATRQYRHNDDNSPSLFEPEGGFVLAYDRNEADKALQIIDDAISKPETTHYAVIDEHGEIAQVFKVATYRNAEFLCKSLIQLISHDHDTSGWTVRRVTIHN